MTSLHAYNGSKFNNHQLRRPDLQGLTLKTYPSNSILGFLTQEQTGLGMVSIIQQALAEHKFKDPQTSVTLFVPLDGYPPCVSTIQAQSILKGHTCSTVYSREFLMSSRGMTLSTQMPSQPLFVEYTPEGKVLVNGHSFLLGTRQCGNSLVCFVDKIL